MAFRRFTEVSLIIRSEVGVTARTPLAAVIACAREPSRVALTDCFECLLADRDAFFFVVITSLADRDAFFFVVITSPLGTGRMEVNT